MVFCKKCNGNDIEERAWVKVNTRQIIEPADENSYYCATCQEDVEVHITLEKSLPKVQRRKLII